MIPPDGEILLDGISLTDPEIESLRKQMGVVTQGINFVQRTPFFNNIAFGKEDATLEDVMEAAKVADTHNHYANSGRIPADVHWTRFKAFGRTTPKRLPSRARCWKIRPFWVLDEATSALILNPENWCRMLWINLMKNRTSICNCPPPEYDPACWRNHCYSKRQIMERGYARWTRCERRGLQTQRNPEGLSCGFTCMYVNRIIKFWFGGKTLCLGCLYCIYEKTGLFLLGNRASASACFCSPSTWMEGKMIFNFFWIFLNNRADEVRRSFCWFYFVTNFILHLRQQTA